MAKKCDVLYIHSTRNPEVFEKPCFPIMPMGIIGILNGIRKKGIDVVGLNIAAEQHTDPDFSLTETLKKYEYKILMTDLHWYVHSYGAMCIVKKSKEIYPDVPTIIGGYTSTIYPIEIMENFSAVDYVVTGDSDLPMDMLVDYLLNKNDVNFEDIPNLVYRKDSEIVTSVKTWAESTLDNIDFIHTDFFEHADTVRYLTVNGATSKTSHLWLCIARGCKFNCGYCCGANVNMKTLFRRCNILKRSPGKVAEDFCELTNMGYMQVCPSHDFEMFGKDYYRTIFSKIRESGVKPGMYLECFQLPSKDYIDEMEKTFDKKQLVLVISPISGNEKLRKENGKIFTNDELYEILDYIRTKGIMVGLYYTLNPVGETEEQFNDTCFQMQYLKMKYKFTRKQILYQSVVIDPLAVMRDFDKIKNVEYNNFMDYYKFCQIPGDPRYTDTGFDDGAEVSYERRQKAYSDIFPD